MSKVLVTGANGYIGTCVVAELQKRGCQVVACDVAFTNLPGNVDKLAADIFDPDVDIYDLAGQPDCLIHLAWRNGFQHNADTHLQDEYCCPIMLQVPSLTRTRLCSCGQAYCIHPTES